MDWYFFLLFLGGLGILIMAVSGVGHHSGHQGHEGHEGHEGHHGHDSHQGTHIQPDGKPWESYALALLSPRTIFSICIGIGATGLVLEPFLAGPVRAVAALLGGVAFERLLMQPIWNFVMRFASKPAETLDLCISDEAYAVTSFDKNGDGIIQINLDGQTRQLLGTLSEQSKQEGVKIAKGTRLQIDEVDGVRGSCKVSLYGTSLIRNTP